MSGDTTTFDPGASANLNTLWAGLALEEWGRLGLSLAVVCPGSRSAPLALAASSTRGIDATVCHDERAAAFMALGAARATGRPALVITTSGTAVANLLPAAVEASQTGTPLILVTADRPPELRECGANQSIRQGGMLGEQARWSFEVPCSAEAPGPEFILSTADEAWQRAMGRAGDGGAVHLNWAFREPLSPTPVAWDRSILATIARWIGGGAPWRVQAGEPCDADGERETLLARIAAAAAGRRRPIIVAGACHTPGEREACRLVARASACPVIADIGSGLRGDESIHGMVAHGDLIALAGPGAVPAPDFIVRLGGNVASRRVSEFVRMSVRAGATLEVVRSGSVRYDPDHGASIEIDSPLRHAAPVGSRAVTPRILPCEDGFTRSWLVADRAVAEALAQQLDPPSTALSEPAVARALARSARGAAVLALGNSMPIRDADMHASRGMVAPEVVVSRGASGIDGLVATALGHARASRRRTVLLIGDLSLLHDIGSLSLVRSSPVPITIVAVNNDGGGIFHFLPLAAHHGAIDPWCTAPHGLSFEAAGALFGIAAKSLPRGATVGEFLSVLGDALASPASMLIEVRTEREENLHLHRELQQVVAEAVAGARKPEALRHEGSSQ